MAERAKRRSHEAWLIDIQSQVQSGQSIQAFCADRGLAVHSFHYHKQRMREGAEAGGFVQVHASGSGLRLRPDGGCWSIELDPDFDAGCLRRVLGVLGG